MIITGKWKDTIGLDMQKQGAVRFNASPCNITVFYEIKKQVVVVSFFFNFELSALYHTDKARQNLSMDATCEWRCIYQRSFLLRPQVPLFLFFFAESGPLALSTATEKA